jgi:hypothetical protein
MSRAVFDLDFIGKWPGALAYPCLTAFNDVLPLSTKCPHRAPGFQTPSLELL